MKTMFGQTQREMEPEEGLTTAMGGLLTLLLALLIRRLVLYQQPILSGQNTQGDMDAIFDWVFSVSGSSR